MMPNFSALPVFHLFTNKSVACKSFKNGHLPAVCSKFFNFSYQTFTSVFGAAEFPSSLKMCEL